MPNAQQLRDLAMAKVGSAPGNGPAGAKAAPAASPGMQAAMKGDQMALANHPAQALAAYDQALSLGFANAGVYRNRGVMLLRLSRTAEAIGALRQAVGLEPSNAELHRYLGILLYNSGNQADGSAEIRKSAALDPKDATTQGLLKQMGGQAVTLRVASLAPSHTELVFALGAQDQLVAVTSYSNWPPEAEALPRLKGWANLKPEDVLALKPDLVLTSSVCQDSLVDALKAAGIRVLHSDPRSLADVAHSFVEIGSALGREKEARALADEFDYSLGKLAATVPSEALRPRVYVEEWHQPPMASGNWVPDLVRLAGGEPFVLPPGSLSRELSWEELLEFDPQLVIYSVCGLGLQRAPEEFLKVEGWDRTEAARKRAVFSVNDDLFNRPGPRLIEGAKLFQQLIAVFYGGGQKFESKDLRRLVLGFLASLRKFTLRCWRKSLGQPRRVVPSFAITLIQNLHRVFHGQAGHLAPLHHAHVVGCHQDRGFIGDGF